MTKEKRTIYRFVDRVKGTPQVVGAPQGLIKVGSHYHTRVKGPGGGQGSWNPVRPIAVGERLLTDTAVLIKEAVVWQGRREGVKYISCPLPSSSLTSCQCLTLAQPNSKPEVGGAPPMQHRSGQPPGTEKDREGRNTDLEEQTEEITRRTSNAIENAKWMKRLRIKENKGWVLVSRKGKEEGMNGVMTDKGASLFLAASQSEILKVVAK